MAREWELSVGSAVLRMLVAWSRYQVRRGLPSESLSPVPWTRRHLTVAAVQWQAQPIGDVRDMLTRLAAVFHALRERDAALVVFPEDLALTLLGLLTERVGTPRADDLPPAEIGRRLARWAPVVEPLYLDLMATLAAAYGVMVVAGSSLGRSPSGGFENRTWVIGPDGAILGRQAKLHLLALETSWGIVPGRRATRPAGSLPLAAFVCNDATHFETYRMAAAEGAELVAIPIADPDPDYGVAKARRGAWARTQETGLPSVVAALTGDLFGMTLTGKAGVYVPAPLTEDASGVLAESPNPVGDGVVTATLDLDRLADFRRSAVIRPRAATHRWLVPRYRALVTPVAGEAATERVSAPDQPDHALIAAMRQED